MRQLILRWLFNILGLFAAIEVVSGITYAGPTWKIAIVAAVFGVVNALLRPLLTILTCPLILVTLGLFTFVVNGLLLLLTARLAGGFGVDFTVEGLWAAILGAIVVSAVSIVLSLIVGKPRRGDDA